MESYRYRKSASKYRVCQKIVHFLFFNVDSTESPDGLQSVLSSVAFPGRLTQLRTALWTELWAPLYTQCRLAVTAARNPYWTPGFFLLLSSQFSYLPKHCRALRRLRQFSVRDPRRGNGVAGAALLGGAAREFDSQSNGRWRVKRPIGDTVVPAAQPAYRARRDLPARRSNQFLTADARAKRRWLGLGCPPWRGVSGGGCLRARVFGSNSCNYMPHWAEFSAFVHKLWPIFALENYWKYNLNT